MINIPKKVKRRAYWTVKRLQCAVRVFFDKGDFYTDNFFLSIKNGASVDNKLVIFSHFDKDDLIDDYVVYYLSKLKKMQADIVFVSTAEGLTETEIQKVLPICKQVIVKNNIGYDFGAWRTGIEVMLESLDQYEQLIMCNDSVYAPLFDLQNMFDQMQDKYNFWGITDNYQHGHHIQSYFMVFNKTVFSQQYFLDFWKNIRVFKHKESIIQNYEVGLTRLLRAKKHTYAAYYASKYKCKKNITHYDWKKLIIEKKCPIIKIELLRDNPTKTDISDWKEVLLENTDYDISMINNHLIRVKNDS